MIDKKYIRNGAKVRVLSHHGGNNFNTGEIVIIDGYYKINPLNPQSFKCIREDRTAYWWVGQHEVELVRNITLNFQIKLL
jgi:hypothetical protein